MCLTQWEVKPWQDTRTQITQSHYVAGLLWAHRPSRAGDKDPDYTIYPCGEAPGHSGTGEGGEIPVPQQESNMHLCPRAEQSWNTPCLPCGSIVFCPQEAPSWHSSPAPTTASSHLQPQDTHRGNPNLHPATSFREQAPPTLPPSAPAPLMFQLEIILTCDPVVFWMEVKQQVITSSDIEGAELISDPGIYHHQKAGSSWGEEFTAYPVI